LKKRSPRVLHALKLLGPEEILNLSQVLTGELKLAKAAGAELVSWVDKSPGEPSAPSPEATVLEFPARKVQQLEVLEEPVSGSPDPQAPLLMSAEVILMQRELAKTKEADLRKLKARSGYQKATEMYLVKERSSEGKEQLRFASTDGVLINKKQA
jgi:hypothetical protein